MMVGGALGVGTPDAGGVRSRDAALQTAMLTGQVAVVAFTDGQPNCALTR
jgi:hypothetical protein